MLCILGFNSFRIMGLPLEGRVGDWFVGEIRLFAHVAEDLPKGWLECDGRELSIPVYPALFSLLSNAYGGDGIQTFRLPDLRGRTPVLSGVMPDDRRMRPKGDQLCVGESGGQEEVALTPRHMPPHRHSVRADTVNAITGTAPSTLKGSIPSTATKPKGAAATAPAAPVIYGKMAESDRQALAAASVKPSGGSRPHENRQPFLPLTYGIATGADANGGIYPPGGSHASLPRRVP